MPRSPFDASLWVKFEQREVMNQAKSYGEKILDRDGKIVHDIKGAGHPVFDNVDYVQIVIPGDKTSQVDRPVTYCGTRDENGQIVDFPAQCRFHERPSDCDVHRFFDEWKMYKDGQKEQTSGTSLKNWPGIPRGVVEELAYFKVYTVEQLAELNDSNAARFFAHRERARLYLKTAEKVAIASDIRAELDAKDAALSAMKLEQDAMREQLRELVAAAQRGQSTGDVTSNKPAGKPQKEAR